VNRTFCDEECSNVALAKRLSRARRISFADPAVRRVPKDIGIRKNLRGKNYLFGKDAFKSFEVSHFPLGIGLKSFSPPKRPSQIHFFNDASPQIWPSHLHIIINVIFDLTFT